RPAEEHAVELETKIVVEVARGVFLDEVRKAARAFQMPARLRRPLKTTFALIRLERHDAFRWCGWRLPFDLRGLAFATAGFGTPFSPRLFFKRPIRSTTLLFGFGSRWCACASGMVLISPAFAFFSMSAMTSS